MSVAITGAHGHLGSLLLAAIPGAVSIGSDVRYEGATVKAILAAQPEVVIHCAALVGSTAAERAGREATYEVNVEGTRNVAAGALRAGARFVHLSSCSIYDPKGVRPYTERDGGDRAHTIYGQSKWMAEQVLYRAVPADRLLIIRPDFVYGDSPHDVSLLGQCARAKRTHRAMILDMDMTLRKAYLYDLDFVAAVTGLIEAKAVGIVNIASEDHRPWSEFRRLLVEQGKWPDYVINRPDLDYKGDNIVSVAHLKELLPWWKEQMPIEAGVTLL